MAAATPPVFLIGMMGSGKSTVGRLLAQALDYEFVDCDRVLESRSGVTVATMFEVEGEEAFRRREAAVLDELTSRAGIVLATGGGAVLQEANRQHLHTRGLAIYLKASVDEIARRLARDRTRPLLQTADPRGRIAALLEQREPLYVATAHLAFASPASNPRKLVRRIAEHSAVRQRLGLAPLSVDAGAGAPPRSEPVAAAAGSTP